jgi:REP element-mobilizing transposase RayT
MPRRLRVLVEGLTYHVYNRVGRGEAPFKLEDEAERFWSLMHKVKKRDGLAVMAWCIMPNHYHLAVRTASVPLWRSIRSLQHAYTQGFNRRCKVLGPLWQARYKARPVEGTDSLLRLLAYIHLNPARVRMVDDPGEVPVERPSRAAGVGVPEAVATPNEVVMLWLLLCRPADYGVSGVFVHSTCTVNERPSQTRLFERVSVDETQGCTP